MVQHSRTAPCSLVVKKRLLFHVCTLSAASGLCPTHTTTRRSSHYLGHCLSWQREDCGGRIMHRLLSLRLEVVYATSTHVSWPRDISWPELPLVEESLILLQGLLGKGPNEEGKAGVLTTQSITVNISLFYR